MDWMVRVLLLFESYLSNRRQYIEIDEIQSETLQ